jgi:1-phosphofructokinase family hexose kinase
MSILTVTPNPAFDRIQTIANFAAGQVWRATALTLCAGGKGINVARAARTLGQQAVCTGLLGGHSGRLQAQFMAMEGIPAHWIWIDGETRVSVIVIDPKSGETTVLNEEGPTVSVEDWKRLQDEVLAQSAQAQAVCISGSLPRGLSADAMGNLVQALNRTRQQVWVDSSGGTLKTAVQARPAAIKINHLEAAEVLGWRPFSDVPTAVQAAQTILQSGTAKVIITLGKTGAILASDAGAWFAKPPAISAVCPIGSGDAFLAGIVCASLNHEPDPEALRQGVAAGSANALSVGGGKFTREDFDHVLGGTRVTALQ